MIKNIIKEVFVSFLIVISILLLTIIIFYNKVSIGQVIPYVEEYNLPEEIKQEIEDNTIDGETEVIITYELDASDLKKYERTKEYNKGKKNPFAVEFSNPPDENQTSSNNSANNNSTNFYDDVGIK